MARILLTSTANTATAVSRDRFKDGWGKPLNICVRLWPRYTPRSRRTLQAPVTRQRCRSDLASRPPRSQISRNWRRASSSKVYHLGDECPATAV